MLLIPIRVLVNVFNLTGQCDQATKILQRSIRPEVTDMRGTSNKITYRTVFTALGYRFEFFTVE